MGQISLPWRGMLVLSNNQHKAGVDVISFHLDHGAGSFLLNTNGDPPIEKARCWGDRETMKILKEAMES